MTLIGSPELRPCYATGYVNTTVVTNQSPASGVDSASPVTPDYADRGTFTFTGGTIDKVVVDVTGDRYVDHEAQVRAWLLTD